MTWDEFLALSDGSQISVHFGDMPEMKVEPRIYEKRTDTFKGEDEDGNVISGEVQWWTRPGEMLSNEMIQHFFDAGQIEVLEKPVEIARPVGEPITLVYDGNRENVEKLLAEVEEDTNDRRD